MDNEEFTRDQKIRIEALAIASEKALPSTGSDFVIERAEQYEDYIRNGVIHNA